ncbi:alpha/beta hydrolase [Actinomadura fulvescens]|uniref:AB hydrolase-1 domain-containing protein n=1 Tax=Actinomadura fulvescens TaxID=46160 RepID=A0ABN3QWQ2_9ACTN
MTELDEFDLEPRLSTLNCPTLVLVGRHDPMCPLPNSQRIAEAIPHAQLRVFDHSGHYPYLEEPEAFRTAIDTWTREHFGIG